MTWSVVKADPLVLTVTATVPPDSPTVSLLTETEDSAGAASSSVMVMVCCVPMAALLCEAVISTVSASSSKTSCTAVTVAITEVDPAASVRLSELMV